MTNDADRGSKFRTPMNEVVVHDKQKTNVQSLKERNLGCTIQISEDREGRTVDNRENKMVNNLKEHPKESLASLGKEGLDRRHAIIEKGGSKIKGLKRKLDFTRGIIVPSDGRSRGLAMLWKEGVDVQFKSCSNMHIDVVVCERNGAQLWQEIRFYGHPDAGNGCTEVEEGNDSCLKQCGLERRAVESLQEKGTCHSEKMEMSTISSESSYEKELECKEIIIQNPQWRPECCIYKVPKRLREVKKEAYTPRLISVGPLHRNIDTSNEMEMLKQKYFQEFFLRTWKDRMEFENIVKKNEENIRHCYAAEISLPGKEDFVKMILLDSIFIIELFLRTATRQEYEKDDYILSKPWLDEGIKHDLILLENQLPFFILDELHHHIGRSTSIHKSFINLACNYFFPGDQKKPIEKEVKHFTDLQRYFYLPRNLETGSVIEHLRSATKLDTAGLKFQIGCSTLCDKSRNRRPFPEPHGPRAVSLSI
nr:upf0481 protein [Quercus suber]